MCPTTAQTGPYLLIGQALRESSWHAHSGRIPSRFSTLRLRIRSPTQETSRCGPSGKLVASPRPSLVRPAAKRSETKQQLQPHLQAQMVAVLWSGGGSQLRVAAYARCSFG